MFRLFLINKGRFFPIPRPRKGHSGRLTTNPPIHQSTNRGENDK